MKNQVEFSIDEEGNLSLKVAGIGTTIADHAAMDKLLADLATAMGGTRECKETLPLHTIANKQTLTQ